MSYTKSWLGLISELQILRSSAVPEVKSPKFSNSAEALVSALEQFQECVRYLNTRRTNTTILSLNSESAVQDVLYLMLRPFILDLVPENPVDKAASRFSIQDFLSQKLECVVEAKFVRDKRHGKEISKELHDDIENYRNHPSCKNLIFFIYDPDAYIPDSAALKRQIEISRTYGGQDMAVKIVIKP